MRNSGLSLLESTTPWWLRRKWVKPKMCYGIQALAIVSVSTPQS
jgi:hypothetical protein